MLGSCGCAENQCRAQARLAVVLLGYPPIGVVAEQYVEALGGECVWCHGVISNRETGHFCRLNGNEHDDCGPRD
jgi:hypothetical protein